MQNTSGSHLRTTTRTTPTASAAPAARGANAASAAAAAAAVGKARAALLAVAALVAFACVLVALAPMQADAKSYSMPKVDIQAQVETDGSLHVVEQRTFDFDGDFTAVW